MPYFSHTKAHRGGFTLVEIMIVVTIIGLLAMLSLPAFSRARTTSINQRCILNQKYIFEAVQMFEFDFSASLFSIRDNGVQIRNTLLNSGYSRIATAFECPASSVDDNDDYQLLYDNRYCTNTICVIRPNDHIYE